MPSPTQRSLAVLKRDGWTAQVVERWNAHARVRVDLFGCIDILAIRKGHPVTAIQATSTTNLSARYHKSVAIPALRTWLQSGCVFELWGWSKKGKRGQRKLWTLTRRVVTLEDLK